eukprot:m.484931 g.484931  ORF g.484931 m.484931 type:complete len:68 (-) comp57206_c0_seq3:890-1093(-)
MYLFAFNFSSSVSFLSKFDGQDLTFRSSSFVIRFLHFASVFLFLPPLNPFSPMAFLFHLSRSVFEQI